MAGKITSTVRALRSKRRAKDIPAHLQRHHQMRSLQHKTPFKLKPHHAKPVRKRHLLGISISLLFVAVFVVAGIRYVYGQFGRQLDATLTVIGQTDRTTDADGNRPVYVRSTLGFGLTVDLVPFSLDGYAKQQPAGVQNYRGVQLEQSRPYSGLNIVLKQQEGAVSGSVMQLSVQTDSKLAAPASDSELRQMAQRAASPSGDGITNQLKSESRIRLGGVDFLKQVYTVSFSATSVNGGFVSGVTQKDVYVGVLPNGMPIVVVIKAANPIVRAQYERVFSTFSAAPITSSAAGEVRPVAALPKPGLLDMAEKIGVAPFGAQAAGLKEMDKPRIVATNAPAVVKLYHVVCGAILYRDKPLTRDGCSGDSGTGFFVSSDGYIATNGHVVSSDPKGAVTNNLTQSLLARMMQIDGYAPREISSVTSKLTEGSDMQSIAEQAIGNLPSDALKYQNQKDFYIVALSTDAPDLDQIVNDRTFKETTTLKLAQLKAIDYEASDLTNDRGFTHSDVALLKVQGSNYPYTRLGSLNGIVQGMSITVVGYPGDAESNNLVKDDILQTTATEGIVSAVREVNGGNLKVVQSDVNIGHGNSGGPAFDQYGQVFGVATYMLGGDDGSASISYLRDIKDIKNLMRVHGITVNANSQTQALWESGLDDFYHAHYHSAIAKFQQVKKLYGPHTLAGRYVALARDRIAAGGEAQSKWVPIGIVAGLVASLAGLIAFVVMIVRHRAHHHVYKAVQLGYIHGPFASMQEVRHHHAARY